jgi:hypothetical protein
MSRLGDTIRMKLDGGVLPRGRPEKVFAGHGHDGLCSACDAAILPTQVEWSLRNKLGRTHRFHLGCFKLWEVEVCKRWGGTDHQPPPPLELVVLQIRLHASGLCLSCLSELTDLPLDIVAATIAQLGQTFDMNGVKGKCQVCGDQRRLLQF